MTERFRVLPPLLMCHQFRVLDDDERIQPIELSNAEDAFAVCRALNAYHRQETAAKHKKRHIRLKAIVKNILKELEGEQ